MMDKHKSHDPRTSHIEKTRIELEENEDLEVDEGTEATAGNPESPDNTGAERRVVNREGDYVESDPDAIDEEMRNQDA